MRIEPKLVKCKGVPSQAIQCEGTYPFSKEFFVWRDEKRGILKRVCKTCSSEYHKKYRENNLEKIKKSSRRKYQESRETRLARCKENYRRNRERYLNYDLERKYGITAEEYNSLAFAQKHLCAICREPETATRNGKTMKLAVDHCHDTGKVRGLLCGRCNTAIGSLEKKAMPMAQKLLNVAKYLDVDLTALLAALKEAA